MIKKTATIKVEGQDPMDVPYTQEGNVIHLFSPEKGETKEDVLVVTLSDDEWTPES